MEINIKNLLLAVMLLLMLGGCASVMTRTGPPQGYYSGTKADVAVISNKNSGVISSSVAAVDMPFSALLDTVLLPYDYWRSGEDKTKTSPQARLEQKEKEAQKKAQKHRDLTIPPNIHVEQTQK